MPFDLVIRNGTVVDGTGAPSVTADVAISGGRIAEIGAVRDTGRTELDADGHAVTPGFIDGHTHMDAQVFWDPLGSCSGWHGVTTVITGNCGFTLAPARPDRRDLVMRNLERAEDISRAAMEAGIEWTWESFAEYLDAVERQPKAINYACNIGHSALRTYVMGERAFDGDAGESDLDAMERELQRALAAGAIGFSTSRSEQHETADDRPVASRRAPWSEVTRLVQALAAHPGALFELAHEPAAAGPEDERRDFFDRLRRLTLDTGVPVTFGVSPVVPRCYHLLELIDATVAAGGRMFGQTHCKGVSAIVSFRTRTAFDRLPGWAAVRSLPLERQRAQLQDPAVRARLVAEAHDGDYGHAVGPEARRPDYSRIWVLDRPLPPYVNIAEEAARRRVDPVELMIDLALETDFHQLFIQSMIAYDPDDVLAVMRHPHTVMTFSDSGAHVSQIADSSIHTYMLAYWVRERQAFTFEEAVHMVTQTPAVAWGFADRGVLKPGFVADINVLDPDRLTPKVPVVSHDLPGGVTRLTQQATGLLATIVGGQVVFRDGEHTGALPGRLLRAGAGRPGDAVKIRIAVAPGGGTFDPASLTRLIDELESLGFDTIWLSDIPLGGVGDPVVGLSYAAGRTSRLKLGANLVPLGRNPLLLAKELAQLDRLSSGRLLLSIVPGINQPGEREALGIGRRNRGAYLDEVVPLLRRWWAGEPVTHHSEQFSFDEICLPSRPVQDPLELWFGGVGPAALTRTGHLGDGWLGAAVTPPEAGVARRRIEEAAAEVGRSIDPEHFGLSIPYTRTEPDEATLANLRKRRPDGDIEQLVPVGRTALRDLLCRHVDNGLSKFVVRPSGPLAGWDDELSWLADAVLDLQT